MPNRPLQRGRYRAAGRDHDGHDDRRQCQPVFRHQGRATQTGQFFITIDPGTTSGDLFADRIQALVVEFHIQPGTRTLGDNRPAARQRAEKQDVDVNKATLEKIRQII